MLIFISVKQIVELHPEYNFFHETFIFIVKFFSFIWQIVLKFLYKYTMLSNAEARCVNY